LTDLIRNDHDLIVFSDFDGTISRRDVGNRLFHHFSDGKSEEVVARWKAGEIDSRDNGFDLDPGFAELAKLCRTHNLPLYIVSDGLDLYIRHLLNRQGLDGLPVFSNRAIIEAGRLNITWPYADDSCGQCGNCKGLRRPGGGYHLRQGRSGRILPQRKR